MENSLAEMATLFKKDFIYRTLMLWVVVSCLWSTFYLFSTYLPKMFAQQGVPIGGALLTAAIVNAAPIPTHLVGAWLLEKWGRKPTIAGYATIALVGVVIFAFSNSYAIGLLGASLALGFMAATFSFTKLFSAEYYPTRIRGIGTTWMEAVGRGIAGVLITFIIAILLSTSGVLGACALIIGLGIIGLITFMLFSRETRGMPLERLDPEVNVYKE